MHIYVGVAIRFRQRRRSHLDTTPSSFPIMMEMDGGCIFAIAAVCNWWSTTPNRVDCLPLEERKWGVFASPGTNFQKEKNIKHGASPYHFSVVLAMIRHTAYAYELTALQHNIHKLTNRIIGRSCSCRDSRTNDKILRPLGRPKVLKGTRKGSCLDVVDFNLVRVQRLLLLRK